MKERFEGENRQQLIAALKRQDISSGSSEIAEKLAGLGELVEFRPGENIILQDGTDNDIYFLIAGATGVFVNSARVCRLSPSESELMWEPPFKRASCTPVVNDTERRTG